MITRRCTRCKQEKPLTDFGKDKSRKHGRGFKCKPCVREYYQENKEHKSEVGKAYYKANKEAIRSRQAAYEKEHCAEISARKSEYYKNNPEAAKARAIYNNKHYHNNKEHYQAYFKTYNPKWIKNNPDKVRAHLAKRRALINSALIDDTDFEKIAGFYAEAQQRSQDTGVMYHVDHIIPLAEGGAHHESNLQVITAESNLQKGAKLLSQAELDALRAENHLSRLSMDTCRRVSTK